MRRMIEWSSVHYRHPHPSLIRARSIARRIVMRLTILTWFVSKKSWQKEIEPMLKNGFTLEVEARGIRH
jgi:hypothetical protein